MTLRAPAPPATRATSKPTTVTVTITTDFPACTTTARYTAEVCGPGQEVGVSRHVHNCSSAGDDPRRYNLTYSNYPNGDPWSLCFETIKKEASGGEGDEQVLLPKVGHTYQVLTTDKDGTVVDDLTLNATGSYFCRYGDSAEIRGRRAGTKAKAGRNGCTVDDPILRVIAKSHPRYVGSADFGECERETSILAQMPMPNEGNSSYQLSDSGAKPRIYTSDEAFNDMPKLMTLRQAQALKQMSESAESTVEQAV